MRKFAAMKRWILTLVSIIFVSLSSFAEYDGKPWDDDSYKGISFGPVLTGIIIIGIIFYVIPKLASSNKKKVLKKSEKHSSETLRVQSNLIKCPKCHSEYVKYVPEHICPKCMGTKKQLTKEEYEEYVNLCNEDANALRENHQRNNYTDPMMRSIASLLDPTPLKAPDFLSRFPDCSWCNGEGKSRIEVCECYYKKNGEISEHPGYL